MLSQIELILATWSSMIAHNIRGREVLFEIQPEEENPHEILPFRMKLKRNFA